jgi:signal transduction histidine kinase
MKLELELVELGEFLNAAIEMNSPYGAEFKVDFHTELPSNQVFVQADRHRLNQVMANLLSNAAKFSHAGDTVTIRLETDKRQVGGSGLGMAISEQILAAHGATIDYRKNPGPGTTFIVEMKRSKAPQNDQDSDNTAALATGGMNGVRGAAASSTSLPNLADAA